MISFKKKILILALKNDWLACKKLNSHSIIITSIIFYTFLILIAWMFLLPTNAIKTKRKEENLFYFFKLFVVRVFVITIPLRHERISHVAWQTKKLFCCFFILVFASFSHTISRPGFFFYYYLHFHRILFFLLFIYFFLLVCVYVCVCVLCSFIELDFSGLHKIPL